MTTTYGSKTPIYCSSSFEWKDNHGWVDESKLIKIGTHISALDFKGIAIQSARTGKIKYFEPIYDEDGYDCEFMMYGCDNMSVKIWNY
jgi:hypothetical protein